MRRGGENPSSVTGDRHPHGICPQDRLLLSMQCGDRGTARRLCRVGGDIPDLPGSYPLLLAGHKGLEAGSHPEAQLVDQWGLVLAVDLHLDPGFERGLICGREKWGEHSTAPAPEREHNFCLPLPLGQVIHPHVHPSVHLFAAPCPCPLHPDPPAPHSGVWQGKYLPLFINK